MTYKTVEQSTSMTRRNIKNVCYLLCALLVSAILYKIFLGNSHDNSLEGGLPSQNDLFLPHELSSNRKNFPKQHVLQAAVKSQSRDNEESQSIKSNIKGYSYGNSAKRSIEYCNPPGLITDHEEGDVPDKYTLKSVYAVTRHGDRSSIHKLPNHDLPPLSCVLNPSVSDSHTDLITSFLDAMKRFGSRIHHQDIFGLYPRRSKCGEGSLTGKGHVQHLVIGDNLRKAYAVKHDLLSGNPDPAEITVKCTVYTRTYQSGLALLYGLLPEYELDKLKIHVTKNLFFCDRYTSGEPCTCPADGYWREVSKQERSVDLRERVPSLQDETNQELAQIFGVNVSQVQPVNSNVDALMAFVCNSLPLPCGKNSPDKCVTFGLVNKMWEYLDEQAASAVNHEDTDYKYNLLVMYPLLKEITQSMSAVAKGKIKNKFTLYSGHDWTVKPLVKALGIFEARGPPYAARLIFELYSDNTDSKYFIRVLYNGRDKTKGLKFCKPADLRDGLCPLEKLEDYVFKDVFDIFGQPTYRAICTDKSLN